MADVTWADVVALQASLSTVSAGAQTIILQHVNEDLNPSAFGGEDSARYHLARCYLAAHLGELARRNGQHAVASESFGTSAIAITYGTSDNGLKQTAWGAQYADMLRSSPLRIGGGRWR